jgi:hypothetical protein
MSRLSRKRQNVNRARLMIRTYVPSNAKPWSSANYISQTRMCSIYQTLFDVIDVAPNGNCGFHCFQGGVKRFGAEVVPVSTFRKRCREFLEHNLDEILRSPFHIPLEILHDEGAKNLMDIIYEDGAKFDGGCLRQHWTTGEIFPILGMQYNCCVAIFNAAMTWATIHIIEDGRYVKRQHEPFPPFTLPHRGKKSCLLCNCGGKP